MVVGAETCANLHSVRTGFVVPTGIVVVGRVSLLFPLMYAVGGGACRCACRLSKLHTLAT
jgi:hypothetical protein